METLFYIEKIMNNLNSFSNKQKIFEKLSVIAQGNKIDKKYFLQTLVQIIKLYLENPNYAQKMAVCDFLNSISTYVNFIFFTK